MGLVTLNSTPDQAIFIPGQFAKRGAFLLLTSINVISGLLKTKKTRKANKKKKTAQNPCPQGHGHAFSGETVPQRRARTPESEGSWKELSYWDPPPSLGTCFLPAWQSGELPHRQEDSAAGLKELPMLKVHDLVIYGANGGATRIPPHLLTLQRYVPVRYTRAHN